jgi:hypothetical protein
VRSLTPSPALPLAGGGSADPLGTKTAPQSPTSRSTETAPQSPTSPCKGEVDREAGGRESASYLLHIPEMPPPPSPFQVEGAQRRD